MSSQNPELISELAHLRQQLAEATAAREKAEARYASARAVVEGQFSNDSGDDPVLTACNEAMASVSRLPDDFDREDFSLNHAVKELVDTRDELKAELAKERVEVERLKRNENTDGERILEIAKDRDNLRCQRENIQGQYAAANCQAAEFRRQLEEAKEEAICAVRMSKDILELLREIRDGEVNPEDEADKYLRDHTSSELSKAKGEVANQSFVIAELEDKCAQWQAVAMKQLEALEELLTLLGALHLNPDTQMGAIRRALLALSIDPPTTLLETVEAAFREGVDYGCFWPYTGALACNMDKGWLASEIRKRLTASQ